ncbi:hypothetical protein TTHERM_00219140 (macronuclear) [Tetrahymena thermophila SB210]|uniref:Uncharacterized protein n=1 Tax=Tetrahymena thermophila (strain SB210) TaxID=312017 RepID=I7M2G4_TETTS|nr:hypothetical protein TTHERM_00219140 [Tetrahymena thermophila SB210]EAS00341.2 hypothetical protein TTHERM_00219140 [Tetrahymena thermophila SB210]|eukprot:XP_001020586.2 hypothetical protein TTHERM_00219140 [Tetrahymena thermophila SB210]
MSEDSQTNPKDKNAKQKVQDFFMQAPGSIKKSMDDNNQSFWNKVQDKAKQQKQKNENEITNNEDIQNQEQKEQSMNEQNNKQQQDLPIIQDQNNEAEKKDNKNQGKKRDEVKDFFSQLVSTVGKKTNDSADQMMNSIRKKQEEKKQKKKEHQDESDMLKAVEEQQNDLKQDQDDKTAIEIKKETLPEKIKEQAQANQPESQKQEIQPQNNLPVVETTDQPQEIQKKKKEKQIDKLAYFFTNSTTAVSQKASQQYEHFKDKVKEKQQKKNDEKELDKSFQKMIKEEEELRKQRSSSFTPKSIGRILPHNRHYQEEFKNEQRKQSDFAQNESSDQEQHKGENNQKNKNQNNQNKNRQSIQHNLDKQRFSQSPNSQQKLILKRNMVGQNIQKQSQNKNYNQELQNSQKQHPEHVYVRNFVEKEFDKEEKLREAARKKRELELQLLQVNQELIHLRKDVTNEEKSPKSSQFIVKKGKIIPPIKEHNQVKAMIQISDDKKALEDAMNLVKRMQQERKLKEQQAQNRMKINSAKFKSQLQEFKDNGEDYFYQKELQRKNEILNRMQEYELKKLEGIKLQNASKQFIQELIHQGPREGKISQNYRSNVSEIQKELEVNLSQVRVSKLQTPLLDKKKQSLQNVRNFEDSNKSYREQEEINDRQEDINDRLDDYKIDSKNQIDDKNYESSHISQNKYDQESQKAQQEQSQQSKKNYGSIFTKRVIAHDQQVKQFDRMLSEEKKKLYEKRMNYSKQVKVRYQPKNLVDNYNFYQDAIFLKQQMKVSDQMNMDYYHPEKKEPLRSSIPQQEYEKYSKEPSNYIEANRAWKIHNKVILNHEYPQSEQIKNLQF